MIGFEIVLLLSRVKRPLCSLGELVLDDVTLLSQLKVVMCSMVPDSNVLLRVVDTKILEYWGCCGICSISYVPACTARSSSASYASVFLPKQRELPPRASCAPFCEAQSRTGFDQQCFAFLPSQKNTAAEYPMC